MMVESKIVSWQEMNTYSDTKMKGLILRLASCEGLKKKAENCWGSINFFDTKEELQL